MTKRFSDAFGISHQQMIDVGAFDPFLDIDAPFYVDPFLLRTTEAPELKDAEQSFRQYFKKVITLLRSSRNENDVLQRRAQKRLRFPEVNSVHLGYSTGESGSGIGPKLAKAISITAEQIIAAGIENPTIFELVGLLEEGIGADRVSDMTVRIILPHLLDFTERVSSDLSLSTTELKLGAKNRQLPWVEGMTRPAVLVPVDLLRHLPVAEDWHDIDCVCSENEALRNRVNPIIGSTWKEATSKHSKRELRKAILQFPELLQDLLSQYEAKAADPYDFEADPEGLLAWYRARWIAAKSPLDLLDLRTDTVDGVHDIVRRICERFTHLVEDQRMSRLFHSDDGSLRKEKTAQLTFYIVAEEYCKANDLDISPEADAGAGPVDFKISRGAAAKVTVEVKYTSNSHLLPGYENQLLAYNKAENTNHSIYMVIRTTESERQIERLREIQQKCRDRGERAPDIIVVDGRLQESASRRR